MGIKYPGIGPLGIENIWGWIIFHPKELEDEDYEDFVKEELSLEKAKILFDKRVGAATFDDHDDITDEEDEIEQIIKSKKGTYPNLGMNELIEIVVQYGF